MVTTAVGHAAEVGEKNEGLAQGEYSGVLFISGDSTAGEYLNGVMRRSEADIAVIRSIPFSMCAAGTDNSMCKSLLSASVRQSVAWLIKGESFALDVMKLYVRRGGGLSLYSLVFVSSPCPLLSDP